jgi:membrane protein
MAAVPVLAMSFAVARGFGFQEFLRARILHYFEQNREMLLQLVDFADKMIDQAKGGAIAGIGIAILFWSVTQLLSNLETSMNQIWKVKKLRTWRRIFTDYFALMLTAPCLFFISTSASVFFVKKAVEGIEALGIAPFAAGSLIFVARLVPYCLFWFFFTFIYLFMPNKKVRFASAFLGGLVGGTIYLIAQWAYIYFLVPHLGSDELAPSPLRRRGELFPSDPRAA